MSTAALEIVNVIIKTFATVVVSAIIGGFITYFVAIKKIVKKYEGRIMALETWKPKVDTDISHSAEERCMLLRSVLACLYGLQELDCNGPVTKGIEHLEKFLDDMSHKTQTCNRDEVS